MRGFYSSILLVVLVASHAAFAGPLHNAVRDGDLEQVRALIVSGEDINERDRNLGGPLHQAALNDFVEIAEVLIHAGADVNLDHRVLGTPLLAAVQRNSADTALLLLEYGAGADTRRSDGSTPLHLAAEIGNAAMIEALVIAGADVNARRMRTDNWTGEYLATHSAASNGHFDIVALLRSLGATGETVEPTTALLIDADPAAGETAFNAPSGEAGCGGCHSTQAGGANRNGPSLAGVVGRTKASVSGNEYSEALRRLGGVWTVAELNAFIAAPLDYAPGSSMDHIGVSNKEKRANIVAFLVSISH